MLSLHKNVSFQMIIFVWWLLRCAPPTYGDDNACLLKTKERFLITENKFEPKTKENIFEYKHAGNPKYLVVSINLEEHTIWMGFSSPKQVYFSAKKKI